MEAIEISVYIVVAFAIAGLIIFVIATLDTDGLTRNVRDMLGMGEERAGTIRATNESLAGDLYRVWQSCTYGTENLTRTIGFSSQTSFADLFATYKKLNLCGTMRSESLGCGYGETMNITIDGTETSIMSARIDGPTVIVASCNPATRQLEIEVST